jgi:hypothetical protein
MAALAGIDGKPSGRTKYSNVVKVEREARHLPSPMAYSLNTAKGQERAAWLAGIEPSSVRSVKSVTFPVIYKLIYFLLFTAHEGRLRARGGARVWMRGLGH